MRTALRSKCLAASAAALLVLGTAACATESEPAPAPTSEVASTGDASDADGADEATAESDTPAKDGDDSGQTDASACTLPEGDQSLPIDAPDVDEWVEIQGTEVPVSEKYGPQHRNGELFVCYAHSPTGALFASVYALVASGYVPGFADNWIKEGDLPGAADTEGQEPTHNGTVTLRGYRIVAASDEQFVVDLALEIARADGTYLNSTRVTLNWEGDRWLVDPSTFNAPNRELTPSMDGFTPWGANK